MRADFWLLALFGVASGSALFPRQDDFEAAGDDSAPPEDQSSDPSTFGAPSPPKDSKPPGWDPKQPEWDPKKPEWDPKQPEWKPITKFPKFFTLAIDETQGFDPLGNIITLATTCNPLLTPVTPGLARVVAGTTTLLTGLQLPCFFSNYAIRLSEGRAIATPYDKWFSPKLPLFLVDDDTKCYTVSKKPYQLYVDRASGQLKYSDVGWLSPNAIATSFFLLGDNPTRDNDPSSAWLGWPTTQGLNVNPWYLCPLGRQQFEVFIANRNFGQSISPGSTVPQNQPFRIPEDRNKCFLVSLAALNASPWQYGKGSGPW